MAKIRKLMEQGHYVDIVDMPYKHKHEDGILQSNRKICKAVREVTRKSHFFNPDLVFCINEKTDICSEIGINKYATVFDGDFDDFKESTSEYSEDYED